MVMPRSRSSGALSMVSKARYSASPLSARYLVMAAVSARLAVVDVTDGADVDVRLGALELLLGHLVVLVDSGAGLLDWVVRSGLSGWSPHWDLNPRPLPYQGSALPAELCGPACARLAFRGCWWAGRESNPHSRRRLIYSQRSSPPAQPTHGLPRSSGRVALVVRGGRAASYSVGADDGTRTRNRRFTKPLLYQLSYVGGDTGW